jgi:diketogulonate reductase-like aldo/keto reductase
MIIIIKEYSEGKVLSIGVSNFDINLLNEVIIIIITIKIYNNNNYYYYYYYSTIFIIL